MLHRAGEEKLKNAVRDVTLHYIDTAWADYLAFVADLRDGIHLVGIGGMDPFQEFTKRVAPVFATLHQNIEGRTVETLTALTVADEGFLDAALRGPSSTWTYMINDRAVGELYRMLLGPGSSASAAAGVLMTWPVLLAWAFWRKVTKRSAP
jgi:preprotein translocase subunit SecA